MDLSGQLVIAIVVVDHMRMDFRYSDLFKSGYIV